MSPVLFIIVLLYVPGSVLDRGTIVEKGTHDDLMAAKGKYYQMYQLQQGSKGLAG